jgi:putative pyoverdin transport system ATP-binding/permease protein
MVVMVAIVNTVADLRPGMELDWQLFLVFALAALTVISLQVYALNLAAQVGERAVGRIRLRVADLVRRSELAGIEQIGPVRVYDTIARETTTIANSAGNIILSLTSAVALAFAAVYIAMLSLVAFLVIGILLSAWAYYYGLNQARGRAALIEAKTADARFFELLSHLLYGFKEVKLHSPRGDDLEKGYLARASDDAEHKNVLAARQFSQGLRAGYAVFYALLGSAVFVLPPYLEDVRMAVKIVYSVMFLFTTLDSITRIVPLLTRANLALDNVDALEARLVASAHEQPAGASDGTARFETLSLQNVTYTYPGPAGSTFTLGPCSLEIRPGRMIFIVGGNGSGKSTFARVLTRLYAPDSGAILWNGAAVGYHNVQGYRGLFSAVYADFHLFDRLYGLANADPARVGSLLADFGLADRVKFADGTFSTTALSTGQRKRLAFIVALLEDRPIYVLDELSSDQDPEFRGRYYRELLPALKARGKTLIVISHDERYFDVADEVLVMRDGKFERGGKAP